ncbi:hypothetical protein KCP77_17630 [Salmonella enterica subsp. enterica]|nr:hypothetical protein KCP77_17630 [Salmonella enterica subsp. enterica]
MRGVPLHINALSTTTQIMAQPIPAIKRRSSSPEPHHHAQPDTTRAKISERQDIATVKPNAFNLNTRKITSRPDCCKIRRADHPHLPSEGLPEQPHTAAQARIQYRNGRGQSQK